jgi:very-short-patch-repair endonuclease
MEFLIGSMQAHSLRRRAGCDCSCWTTSFRVPRRRFLCRARTASRRYYLDMGWRDIMVAVEYDGEHHRKDTPSYRADIVRLEYIQWVGWIVIRVVAGNRPREIVERVRRARALRLR